MLTCATHARRPSWSACSARPPSWSASWPRRRRSARRRTPRTPRGAARSERWGIPRPASAAAPGAGALHPPVPGTRPVRLPLSAHPLACLYHRPRSAQPAAAARAEHARDDPAGPRHGPPGPALRRGPAQAGCAAGGRGAAGGGAAARRCGGSALACNPSTPTSQHHCHFFAPTAAVLVELVQDACALLECRQPLELAAGVRAVQDTAALVPRMERFIGDVCGVRGWRSGGRQMSLWCPPWEAAFRTWARLDLPLPSRWPAPVHSLTSPCFGRFRLCTCRLALPSRHLTQAVFQRGLAHVPEAMRQDNPADVPAILGVWVAGARAGRRAGAWHVAGRGPARLLDGSPAVPPPAARCSALPLHSPALLPPCLAMRGRAGGAGGDAGRAARAAAPAGGPRVAPPRRPAPGVHPAGRLVSPRRPCAPAAGRRSAANAAAVLGKASSRHPVLPPSCLPAGQQRGGAAGGWPGGAGAPGVPLPGGAPG